MEKILVSSCLLGNKVRYDGQGKRIEHDDFDWLLDHCEIIAFCPEVAGGLPTPRAAAEIQQGNDIKVMTHTGEDVSQAFIAGAELALEQCQSQAIKYAILTERSPSCGSTEIYDGSFSGVKKSGQGITAALLMNNGVKVFSQESLSKLRDELE